MPLSPNTILGRYEVLSQLGAGGMGEVYLAHDTQLKRKVALKVLPADLISNRELMHRFEQEARAASALNHPNIITIHEIGAEGDTNFIATEFIEGETLRRKLQTARFEIAETLDIAVQITAALDAAHCNGIVHRDIKPDNIMLRADGLVKVLDFGLAKLTEKKNETHADPEGPTRVLVKTTPGMVMGTVAYMSPEQARGLETDERTDIWSLGIVIYEVLTGRSPFTGETLIDALANILHCEPSPIHAHRQDIPAELERILAKTLRKSRVERYQTARELAVDLKYLQKRLEFEAELERTSQPDQQAEAKTHTFKVPTAEETANVPSNNLSKSFTPIIGREKEIAETTELLNRDDVRLVTITGVGGTGKTTLAKAVAREMLTSFADGVFLIELAAISNSELVASTIAQPLGVKEVGGKPILELLKDCLREREILLVVDNFEQVMTASPFLTELLTAAPRLKILVTSRTVLHLSMEREYAVSPLAVPPKEYSAQELSEYAAVALFVERASKAKASFALTDDNAQSVAEICARLDGLPLAIELAAVRVKILSPLAILAKLEKRLQLLTGGARDLPERQQTMRGAIAWSYDLLDEQEKILFRQLAVFAGGFTIECAEAVVEKEKRRKGEEEIVSDTQSVSSSKIDGLDLITSLVDKSLLVQKEQADGESRFRLLEVVREYALEKLEASGESEMMREKHARYFVGLAESAQAKFYSEQAAVWLNRLEVEHDNFRAVLNWSTLRDIEIATNLTANLRSFWLLHNHLSEGRKWLERALEKSDKCSAELRIQLLYGLGQAALYEGDDQTARKMYEETLAMSLATGDKRHTSMSYRGLGATAKRLGDIATAKKYIKEGLKVSRELNDKLGIAASLNGLGDLARLENNYAEARPLFEETLAIADELGIRQRTGEILKNLGAVEYAENNYEAARKYYSEALLFEQKLGDKVSVSYALDGFAALAVKHKNFAVAAQLAGAAAQLRESLGFQTEPAEHRFREAYLAELHSVINEGNFTEAYQRGRKMKIEEAIGLALNGGQED